MSAEITVQDKSTELIGRGLIALAISSPILLALVDFLDARKAGELTVYVLLVLLVSDAISNQLTRTRKSLSKAKGRIAIAVIALVLILTSAFSSYHDKQKVKDATKELVKEFMTATIDARNTPIQTSSQDEVLENASVLPQAIEQSSNPFIENEADRALRTIEALKPMVKRQVKEKEEFNRKFNAVDLSKALAPQTLTTKDGIRATRKTLETYKTLITERDSMVEKHLVEGEKLFRSQGLTENEIKRALKGMRGPQDENVKMVAELSSAQFAGVEAIFNILAFAESTLGRVTLQDGSLIFQTQAKLDEYNQLLDDYNEISIKEENLLKRAFAISAENKQSMAEVLK